MEQSRIDELFKSSDTVYIFDVDGTLSAVEYGKYTHYLYNDNDWAKAILKENIYEKVSPLKIMQEFLSNISKDRVYVATKIMNEAELKQKKNFLKTHYNIKEENVYGVYKDEEKLEVMNKIKEKYPNIENKNLVMIDDSISVLSYILENSLYSTIHISTFLK